jgi:hypothetical protein
LIALAAGYPNEEIRAIIGIKEPDGIVDNSPLPLLPTSSHRMKSRQHIFIPETEDELRRVFEGDLGAPPRTRLRWPSPSTFLLSSDSCRPLASLGRVNTPACPASGEAFLYSSALERPPRDRD